MEEDLEATPPVETDSGQCSLEIELEALQSIYVNEVVVVRNEHSTTVSINLHPATADKLDEQYVMMTLKFSLDAEYPHKIPEIHIRNPRGLSDDKLISISEDLKSIAESKIGNSMLFEVIEAAKEHLTKFNRPCGECAICLYSFSDEDVFTKTDCYHYFHSHCLARYAKKALNAEVEDEDSSYKEEESPDKELLCPVCRLVINFSGSEDSFPSPSMLRGDEDPIISQDVIEIQKKMADLFQKQVDKGGIIDLEAEKNKYLLEISQVPTRAVDAASPSDLSKEEETDNALAESEDTSKDSKPPSKTAVSGEEKTKGDKKYKQPRNKFDPIRNNKRYDESKPRYKSDRERMPKGASGGTVRDEEENYENDVNEKSSAARSERNSYKRNERPNNYGPPRRYYDDGYSRGNYNRYSDYRGGHRGRRYPSNGYDRHSYQDRGYRGRGGGRPRFERETSDEQSYQSDQPRKEKADSRDLTETESPDGSSKFEKNDFSKNEKDPEKKYSDGAPSKREASAKTKQDARDGCPDRDSRNQKQEDEDGRETKGRYFNDRRYPERSQTDSYRDRRNYSDRRYDDRDTRSPRRGGYDTRDSYNRGYYGRNNRGSYKNSNYRDNFEKHAQTEGRRIKIEENDGIEGDVNKGSDRHRFSDQRSNYRGNRGNPRRNERFHEQDLPQANEKSEDWSNGVDDSHDNKNLCTERYSDIHSSDKKSGGYDDDKVEESNSKKLPHRHEDYTRSYKDNRGYNSQRESYRDSDRNRPNSDYRDSDRNRPNSEYRDSDRNRPNSDYRDYDRNRPNSEAQGNSPHYKRNQRYNHDRPYRNNSDSYQYRNNSSRNYNGNQFQDSEEFFTSSERTVAKTSNATSTPASANEKELTHQEPAQSKVRSSETLSKDPPTSLPSVKPTANFASGSPKMPQPPPGFSNPLKKVVYGLQAANPPPGFSRS